MEIRERDVSPDLALPWEAHARGLVDAAIDGPPDAVDWAARLHALLLCYAAAEEAAAHGDDPRWEQVAARLVCVFLGDPEAMDVRDLEVG